jgi:NADPH-dependent glutamate synthase beta subunit-like oxidoreductase
MKSNLENFKEYAGEYDWISNETIRCLGCYEPPCRQYCPADIPIPEFIRSIRSGNVGFAAKLIREANPMASICGAVCPEEVFCQSHCTRARIDSPINIRELHRYATSYETEIDAKNDKFKSKVAIIGSGPAGLSCAIKLAENGIETIIFEQNSRIGGVPSSSIPGFRLNDEEIDRDIGYARSIGVEFELNISIAEPRELLENFDAVFMATGLAESKRTKIPGGDLAQVMHPLPFLSNLRSGKVADLQGKRIVVIGGGNVSLDVAAGAMAAGAAEVHLLYRRGPREMKVWQSELDEAQKRGVIIDFLVSPVEYIAQSGKLKAVRCIRTRLTDALDESGRRIAEPATGTEFSLIADLAIEAIGLISEYAKDIMVNPDLTTSIDGLFAGGDWARGEGTIVEAVRDGKKAAARIITYIEDKKP